jgi:alpha-ribazole phosphatase
MMRKLPLNLSSSELILIRHAPAETGGRVCGRLDVPARLEDAGSLDRVAGTLRAVQRVVSSPALRCRQTTGALFPGLSATEDARLWEQDFGSEEGVRFENLPDLGALSREALAARRPPGGESFADMVARASPALEMLAGELDAGGPIAVVAHAGIVRAALVLAIGSVPAALAFEVAPLSLTRFKPSGGAWSIVAVNVTL